MSLFESQLKTRARLDAKKTNRAYANLAKSVGGKTRSRKIRMDLQDNEDAAVLACLDYYGIKDVPSISHNFSNLRERIDALCGSAGVMWRDVTLTEGWKRTAFNPMLGRLDTGELVALIPHTLYGYVVYEPKTSTRMRASKNIVEHIEAEAICFYRPLPPQSIRTRDLLSFTARIFDLRDYLFILTASTVATLVGLLPAMANQILFGTVIPSHNVGLILPVGCLLLGVMISRSLVEIIRSIIMARLSTKISATVEAAVMARLLLLPTHFFKEYSGGNLANRAESIISLCQQLTSILLGSGLTFLLSLVYVVQIGAYAPQLVAPALCVMLIDTVAMITITIGNARYDRDALESNATLSGTVTALLTDINEIKLAGAEDRAFFKWASGYSEYARLTYNRPRILRLLTAIVSFTNLLGTTAIYLISIETHLSVADYMSFNVAYGQVIGVTLSLASIASSMATIGPTFELIRPILTATPELRENKPSINIVTGRIEVNNLTFGYDEALPPVIEDLSFTVRPGEYVAIVGKSGCGKSTIMRLLLGFETPQRGAVYYDGKDISEVDKRTLRKSIGTVMQDGQLFLGNILSNITIACPQATLDEAWEAAELAGIADDIRNMPMGMQTVVTEGSGGLSGGQKQRLMIARAICGKRKILIFDEATSALDNVTQRHVSNSLATLRCTRIVIAHRLSTVQGCDRILLIDKGHVIEQGTYNELMELDGQFAELVRRQQVNNNSR